MKTEKADGPQEPGNNRKKQHDGARPKKTSANGPLGFGSVMRDVKGTVGDGTMATPGQPGFDPAALQAMLVDPGRAAALDMGAVDTVEDLLADATSGVDDPTEALARQDRSPSQQAQVGQPLVPTNLGRMTPGALLTTVLDESRKLEIAEAMKELHVELEPEDLGPLVVRLRKGPDGALEIDFRARQGDAARMLEQGSELLRSRLAEAGFASVAIDVSHDAELRLGA